MSSTRPGLRGALMVTSATILLGALVRLILQLAMGDFAAAADAQRLQEVAHAHTDHELHAFAILDALSLALRGAGAAGLAVVVGGRGRPAAAALGAVSAALAIIATTAALVRPILASAFWNRQYVWDSGVSPDADTATVNDMLLNVLSSVLFGAERVGVWLFVVAVAALVATVLVGHAPRALTLISAGAALFIFVGAALSDSFISPVGVLVGWFVLGVGVALSTMMIDRENPPPND